MQAYPPFNRQRDAGTHKAGLENKERDPEREVTGSQDIYKFMLAEYFARSKSIASGNTDNPWRLEDEDTVRNEAWETMDSANSY